MCEDTYQPTQFNYINYLASSGGLSCPESDQRQSYYSMSGIPDLYFDGFYHIVGAGTDAMDGHLYFPVIENHWTNTTPVSVTVEAYSFTPGNASVTAQVEIVGENLASIANTYLRVAIVESDLYYAPRTFEHVLRDMLPNATGTPLTAQNIGDIQTVTLPFVMGDWNPANMQAIVWVQRDTDKFIYNSGNSRSLPFAGGVAVDGQQQAVATGGPLVFGTATVTNFGLEDDVYDITLDTSQLPTGWSAHFTHDGVDGTSVTVPIPSFGTTQLVVTTDAADADYGTVTLNVHSQGAQATVASASFLAVPGGRDVLLIADDADAGYAADYFEPAITAAGRTVTIWNRSLTTVDAASLGMFDAVVWACGNANPGFNAEDRDAIDAYLGAGGRMLWSGQDLAEALYADGLNTWFQNKTRIRLRGGNSGSTSVVGVADDAIGDGLAFELTGGDGANNQSDPDWFQTYYSDAVPIFDYANDRVAGSRTDMNGFKIVFLGFGLEGIADAASRDAVMQNSLDWLIPGGSTPVQDEAPRPLTLAQNQPNPFNPSTKIAFVLDQRGPVRLEVFDLQGHMVRTLINEPMASGDHAVVWDGRTDSGLAAASGTYVYRLATDAQTLTRKMTLVK